MPYPIAAARGGKSQIAQASENGLLSNLLAYWPLSEATGDALDLSGNGRTLSHVNDPGANTGKVYLTAREFAPANTEYFTRSDAALYGGASMTVAIWFNAYALETTPNYHMLIDNLAYGGGWAIGAWGGVTAMSVFFQVGKGGGLYYTASHCSLLGDHQNEWHLYIAWLDYNAKTSYSELNTVAGEVRTDVAFATSGSSYVRFGTKRAVDGQWWSGMIGPIAMWSAVLTADQRIALWNEGAGLAFADFT